MDSVIEQFWYGNIMPSETCGVGNEEIEHLIKLMSTTEDHLLVQLAGTDKASFMQYVDCASKYACCISAQAFRDGFCLAAKLFTEVLLEK